MTTTQVVERKITAAIVIALEEPPFLLTIGSRMIGPGALACVSINIVPNIASVAAGA
jgi:hypothetical protein